MALQSYNKRAEKQQASLIVFPECSPNLFKVTARRAQWQIKNEVFHFKKNLHTHAGVIIKYQQKRWCGRGKSFHTIFYKLI